MRTFDGGATRDTAEGKLSYIRFLSPDVLTLYCEYLERNRDTKLGRRDQDNWKAGIPQAVYADSIGRHFWEAWTQYEHAKKMSNETLCALLFNVLGMMYENLRKDTSNDDLNPR